MLNIIAYNKYYISKFCKFDIEIKTQFYIQVPVTIMKCN